ncbi:MULTISPECIES: phage tail protein [Mesonia]|uniref:Uncharacterized protein n=1 Tax=Mesonia oceanica TaxID=2687242 RepID=A0AC61Y405_9FLAO|nr:MULTISPECIES: phage tail protein [Mesonia]MAN28795.1 hypothetical protein [Mesonia sp.]MAQ41873.1 hypothetical protein [Mesonia sp.]MBJ99004.1 hypothetical protein [Flavobacteriaceae bacterium]VVU99204.1 hypothetical protein FVB9532_00456 [Mesonia oceanica]|tara:strand:- start:41841 stop:42284 length:444 start_codon:yes stop_codon:yes gene_type:complete
MEFSYPAPGFYFQVKIGLQTYSFKEVSGIEFSTDFEEIASGGENDFKYKAFSRRKYSDLELKKGFIPRDSLLAEFLNFSIINSPAVISKLKMYPIIVHLLDKEGTPSQSWIFYEPVPSKWKLGNLDAMENNYLMESITFSYNHFHSI